MAARRSVPSTAAGTEQRRRAVTDVSRGPKGALRAGASRQTVPRLPAPVRTSAGGAANYFAKDDYYVGDGPAELSEWGGKGAEALGLKGQVSKDDFEKLLDLAENWSKGKEVPSDSAKDVRVLDRFRDIASVRLTASWGVDYMMLARSGGRWKIVQVLYQSNP